MWTEARRGNDKSRPAPRHCGSGSAGLMSGLTCRDLITTPRKTTNELKIEALGRWQTGRQWAHDQPDAARRSSTHIPKLVNVQVRHHAYPNERF